MGPHGCGGNGGLRAAAHRADGPGTWAVDAVSLWLSVVVAGLVLAAPASWWWSLPFGILLGSVGFLVRVALVSLLLGENLWVVVTGAAVRMIDGLADKPAVAGG